MTSREKPRCDQPQRADHEQVVNRRQDHFAEGDALASQQARGRRRRDDVVDGVAIGMAGKPASLDNGIMEVRLRFPFS